MRGNSIVEQAVDPVDVFGDRDRQQDFVRSDSRLRRHDIACRVTHIQAEATHRAVHVRPGHAAKKANCNGGQRLDWLVMEPTLLPGFAASR